MNRINGKIFNILKSNFPERNRNYYLERKWHKLRDRSFISDKNPRILRKWIQMDFFNISQNWLQSEFCRKFHSDIHFRRFSWLKATNDIPWNAQINFNGIVVYNQMINYCVINPTTYCCFPFPSLLSCVELTKARRQAAFKPWTMTSGSTEDEWLQIV